MPILGQYRKRFAKIHGTTSVTVSDKTLKITPAPACLFCASKFLKTEKIILVMDVSSILKDGREIVFIHEKCSADLPYLFTEVIKEIQ